MLTIFQLGFSSSLKPVLISLAAELKESLKFLKLFPKLLPNSGKRLGPNITNATINIIITSGIPMLNGSMILLL